MVQPGPDNKDSDWAYTSGYQYRDATVLGFSQTRFSGTGIGEMGDILLLPFSGAWQDTVKNRLLKETEEASVGYYSVHKADQVRVELTASSRVAFHRYTFPGQEARVFLYFFVVQFDRDFQTHELLPRAPKENAPKYLLGFDLGKDKQLQVKIALSTVDVPGARQNLDAEIPDWDFERVRKQAAREWNRYLRRIRIESDRNQKVLFYTSLYHLLLQPSNIADVNGKYRGADGRVAQAPGGVYYSTLSIWDIYRAAFPLLQLVAPERIDGIINTLLIHHQKAGFLPIWTAWGQDNYCMIGNHAIPMILSAWNAGFRGFDQQAALKAMVETSTQSHVNSNWELYNRLGYYPFDSLDNEAVSRTLESGFDDWCVAEMARQLGDSAIHRTFSRRALYYKNLFDPDTRLFRGKIPKGHFAPHSIPLRLPPR
ncbi:MAG: GH92 family glycosyl hydrolase [Haliscomenobacter sp.]|nr:GH92 family glycosyl hydrolase [Haliscomenobacter sp.]